MNILTSGIIFILMIIAAFFSMKQRFSGPYSLAAAAIAGYWLIVTFGEAVRVLLEPGALVTEMPVPAGITLLLMASGWEKMLRSHKKTYNSASARRLWAAIVLIFPAGVIVLLLRNPDVLSIYGSVVLILQSILFLSLLLCADARFGFLVLTAGSVLMAEVLLLLAFVPETAVLGVLESLPLIIAPLVFLIGLGRCKGVEHD
ncbi:hypothetical protein [Spirochaeta dissipatitropha]